MRLNLNATQADMEKIKGAAPDQENAPFETLPLQNDSSFQSDSASARVLNSRSTNTLTQREKALELLKISPQTTYSLRKRGISHPAQRLKELIQDGHIITSTRVNAVDSDGFTHVGVALYALAKKEEARS